MELLKRAYTLLIKLISVKGVVFMLSTVMLFLGLSPSWMWFAFTGTVVGLRTVEKYIMERFKLNLPNGE